ncbi:ATP-dependent DNA helicase Rhp16b [Schizosaccharomyces japonicus yFS275]|uniref:ATP-dependent DNA helicase Rhp16b n=1 Tax=Schizosaccharomyces japonicus (strain yFS275 / FY16936) TaxID=402676 RepID=B6K618_SCHJY|nr:ATP-dependent DNA helicase Rhp16b [Schizosaccharomyces japonicus yFS275]EEB08972.1 ATP-dependent DNA helicase Rhp16b [Schizosaccharomyces japonicus yFS275]
MARSPSPEPRKHKSKGAHKEKHSEKGKHKKKSNPFDGLKELADSLPTVDESSSAKRSDKHSGKSRSLSKAFASLQDEEVELPEEAAPLPAITAKQKREVEPATPVFKPQVRLPRDLLPPTKGAEVPSDDIQQWSNDPHAPIGVKSAAWKKPFTKIPSSSPKSTPQETEEETPFVISAPKNDAPSWLNATPERPPLWSTPAFQTINRRQHTVEHDYVDPEKTTEMVKDLFQTAFCEEEPLDNETDGAFIPGLNVRLLRHQLQGLKWLQRREAVGKGKSLGGILADDMGLGKTVQTLALILSNKSPNANEKSTLVVAPLALVKQWESEVLKKTNMSVLVHHGPSRHKNYGQFNKYDVVVTTYQVLVSEWSGSRKNKGESESSESSDDVKEDSLFDNTWWRVVLDEAQTIKNRNSKSAQACCALVSDNRWCLSGTPLQNNVDELFSLIRFLQIPPMNDYAVWKDQILRPLSQTNGKIAIQRLRTFLQAIMLRRTKEVLQKNTEDGDGGFLSLPKRRKHAIVCKFTPSEKEFYEKLEGKTEATMTSLMEEGTIKKNYTNVLCMLLRLRQACNHPHLLRKHLKEDVDAVVLTSTETKNDEKSTADDDLDDLAKLLGDISIEKKERVEKCEICFAPLKEDSTKSRCKKCRSTISKKNNNEVVTENYQSTKVKKTLQILLDDDIYDDENSPNASGLRKTIIFSQFTSMLDLLEPHLRNAGIGFVRYDGQMKNKDREDALNKLRTKSEVQVLLCSLKCGALGLNLTCASRVILLDVWWNPAVEEQAIDRVHRIGQKHDVDVYKITIADTVEERIVALQDKKRELADGAIGNGSKMDSAKLSMDDILFLFNKRAEYASK